jgi:hypothetical protein
LRTFVVRPLHSHHHEFRYGLAPGAGVGRSSPSGTVSAIRISWGIAPRRRVLDRRVATRTRSRCNTEIAGHVVGPRCDRARHCRVSTGMVERWMESRDEHDNRR